MKLIFVCSPLRATAEKSQERHLREAQSFAEVVEMVETDAVAVVPHVWLTRYLDDDDPDQRALGMAMGEAALRNCHELWFLGPRISEGMQGEIDLAKSLEIPVREWRHDYTQVSPETLPGSAIAGRWEDVTPEGGGLSVEAVEAVLSDGEEARRG